MSLPCVVIAHPASESPSLDDKCLSTVQDLVDNDFRTVVYLSAGTPLIEQLVESGAEVRIIRTIETGDGGSVPRQLVANLKLAVQSARSISRSLTRESPRFVIADARSLPLWPLVATLRGFPSSGYAR